jgi:hypothetical protein
MLLTYILLLVENVFTVYLPSRLAKMILAKMYINCDAEAFSSMEITQSSGVRSQLLHRWKDRFVAMHSIFSGFGPYPNLCYVQQGTLPFMSWRLLQAMHLGYHALHTATDDLESFLWVMVWSLVHILRRAVGTTTTQQITIINGLAEQLSSRNILNILNREGVIMVLWKEKTFKGLLQDWLEICMKSRRVVVELEDTLRRSSGDANARDKCLNEIHEHCIEVYKGFLKTGYEHLRTIKDHKDWKSVVDSNGDLLKE